VRWRAASAPAEQSPHSGGTPLRVADLFAAAREQSGQDLAALARRIEPKYTWHDIVLPADPLAQLREICNQAKLRHLVYGTWGFDRKLSLGKDLNVLFSGPSGTGKTMAAEIIAHELELDLYKIDLSRVVSKYIGDTEKNLDRIFTAAESANAVLLFDEADTVFGKRSQVRDAHDRYANIEIGYLLQRMEEYEGTAILSTNTPANMDAAFIRRLKFHVEFPFPTEDDRRQIWQRHVPAEVPRSDDIDFGFLARQFNLAGGSIRNIVLNAAFLAAANDDVVCMRYMILATRREFQKMGMACSESDFGPYFELLQAG
jgi:SpoVK/Ycf46/Vps4 family AAA+-type ATPase